MIDITYKSYSLRKAIAKATVKVSSAETIDAIKRKEVPKGDIFEFSRAAGLLAIKNTSASIPDCHPLPIEFAAITYELEGMCVSIQVEVHSIYKTGVEVEAMHGAAVTAITIYDMLKPIDKKIEITGIRLLQKEGGKSGIPIGAGNDFSFAVVICSDSIAKGVASDKAGRIIVEHLTRLGLRNVAFETIPDEIHEIRDKAELLSGQETDLIIFTGGTGVSPRDVTPEALSPLLDKTLPGVMETFRQYGQQRTPYAMLSRGVAGFLKNSFVVTLPGSETAVREALQLLFPAVLHVFKVRDGCRHS